MSKSEATYNSYNAVGMSLSRGEQNFAEEKENILACY